MTLRKPPFILRVYIADHDGPALPADKSAYFSAIPLCGVAKLHSILCGGILGRCDLYRILWDLPLQLLRNGLEKPRRIA